LNQLRWDPTLREWAAYATHRQDRTFLPPAEYCPLCPTKPGGFPTEVPRPSYDIVVFENKFPSYKPDAPEPEEPGSALTPTAPGRGICEVVLYSDEHDATLAAGAGILALSTVAPTLIERGLGGGSLVAAAVLLAWSATSVVTALGARWLPPWVSPRGQLIARLVGCAAGQLALVSLTLALRIWRGECMRGLQFGFGLGRWGFE